MTGSTHRPAPDIIVGSRPAGRRIKRQKACPVPIAIGIGDRSRESEENYFGPRSSVFGPRNLKQMKH